MAEKAKGYKKLSGLDYFTYGHRACQGCGLALAVKLVTKALGKDTVVACATGCLEIISSPYPYTSWNIPWIHTAFENAAAVAAGIEAGFKALMRKGKMEKRRINVVAMAGDGGTSDIGLQALSGTLERGHRVIYICYDNEAYMNTGIQRSSSTPYGAWTTTSPVGKLKHGKTHWKKNMLFIADAHYIPYIATASVGYPFDLMKKVEKAKDVDGPSYIHIYSPCPTGWRTPPDVTPELGRLAVQTGVFPLFEIENGHFRLTVKPKELKPVKDYLMMQGRFRHLKDEEIELIQKKVREEYEKLLYLEKSKIG